MDYQKIYKNLTEIRQNERRFKKQNGYEQHHIIPKCLGGSNDKSNLVLLTYREHYIAHWLLTKIHKNDSKIHYSFLCMLRDPYSNRKLTSRMIATIKNNFSEFRKWHAKMVNPMHKDSAKKKCSDRMKKNNPNKGGAWNHTSYPVEIIFNNGTSKKFSFMKEAANVLNIPYSSMKFARRNNVGLKKYGILYVNKCEG
jgi:hypothetical protein